MKKSQMISEIISVLGDTFLLDDESRASAILSKIESLGMKPPVEEICPVIFETKHVWEDEQKMK